MEAKPRHNTVDVPTLFWAAIPGNAGDFPSEESFHTFIEQALCLFMGKPPTRTRSLRLASAWWTA